MSEVEDRVRGFGSIAELEQGIARALESIPLVKESRALAPALDALGAAIPAGCRVVVSIRHRERDRQVRRDARAESFEPEDCGIWIEFERTAAQPGATVEAAASHNDADADLRALVRVQEQAERAPSLHFVALKLLRDRLLPQDQQFRDAAPDRLAVLVGDAIIAGVLRTKRVPNPTHPQFPVTAVLLNRDHKLVRDELSSRDVDDPDFSPVPIRGPELSSDILKDRR